jgi:5'-nucleotidase
MLNRFASATLLALLLAGCASPPPTVPQGPLKVQVLAINDFHGNLLPPAAFRMPDPADPSKTLQIPVGGAEALATAVKQLRKDQPNHVFVAAGDLIGGTPLMSALFFDEVTLESLSVMGLHISAVGNHEFDRGQDELLRRQNGGCHPVDGCKGPHPFKGTGFQYLAASTIVESTGKPLLPAYQIRRFEGLPVAFIGLTTKNTPNLVMPTGVAGLRFDDEADTVNRLVPELRKQGVESIVVLIHEGGYPTGGHNECPSISGPIVDIVKRLDKAVDAVVTGHTHRAYTCRIDGRLVTSGDKYGSMITNIELTIDRNSRDVIASSASNVLVRLDQYGKDPEQTALIAGYRERAKPLTERVVGRLGAEVKANASDPAGGSPMGQLIADSQLAATRDAGAEIALMNNCGIRTGLNLRDDGRITYEDLFTSQPFGNQLITMTLSGAEISALLRRQFRNDQLCSRVQVSQGLSYAWDGSREGEARFVADSVRLHGQPLLAERDYRVTVNAFMAAGGDSFTELLKGRDRRTGAIDVDALEAWVKQLGLVQPPALDRIRKLK